MASTTESRGLGWVIAQFILMGVCLLAGVWVSGQWAASWWSQGPALVLTGLGAGFGLGGVSVLGRNRTVYPEPREGSQLIQHGVYRYVRHPLYSSVIALSFAWGLWWRSWPALALAVVLTVFLGFKASSEERRLIRRFPDYSAYRKTTRRFFPWVF